MKNYNIELPKYIGKLLREILFNNDVDFEISECENMWHFEITFNNDEQQQKVAEFIEQYTFILNGTKLSDIDLQYILEDYDFEDIYNIVYRCDYSIYDVSNMSQFGSYIFDIYECIELSDNISRYFNFEKYANDFLDTQEYVEIENDRIIIFYF